MADTGYVNIHGKQYIKFIEEEVQKFLAEVDSLVAEFNRR